MPSPLVASPTSILRSRQNTGAASTSPPPAPAPAASSLLDRPTSSASSSGANLPRFALPPTEAAADQRGGGRQYRVPSLRSGLVPAPAPPEASDEWTRATSPPRRPFSIAPLTALENQWGVSGTVASQAHLGTLSHSSASFATTKKTGRTTRLVFEDLFHTFTGFGSIGEFLDYQAQGAAFYRSLAHGADFEHAAVRPQLPPDLLRSLRTVKSTHAGAAALYNASLALSGSQQQPQVRTGGLPPLESAEGPAVLLPALEELPAVTRCDAAAIDSLRSKVNAYFLKLSRLVSMAEQLDGRWGTLKDAERHALRDAMAEEKKARMKESDIFDCFRSLTFAHEHLNAITEEVTRCRHAVSFVVRDSPALTSLDHLPPRCHTAVVASCSLARVPRGAASAAGLVVLGLPYNSLETLDFLSFFPLLRVLDLTANALHDLSATAAALAAHATLEDVRLLGNPIALLDLYFPTLAAACPGVAQLDGHTIVVEDRQALGEAGVAATVAALVDGRVEGSPFPFTPAAPAREAEAANASAAAAAAASATAARGGASAAATAAAAVGKKRKANAVKEEAATLTPAQQAELRERLASTVAASVQLLCLQGVAGLAHTPVSVTAAEDLAPSSLLLLQACEFDLSAATPEGEALRRLHTERPDSSHGGGSVASRKSNAKPSAALPAVPLYECSTFLTLEAFWGAPWPRGAEEAGETQSQTQGRAACVEVRLEDYPLAGRPYSGGGASPAGGAAANAGTKRSASNVAGAGAGAGKANARLRRAVAAASAAVIVDVLRPTPSLFSAEIAPRADLCERLRAPLYIRLSVRDDVDYYSEEVLSALLDGGRGGGGGGSSSSGAQGKGHGRQDGSGRINGEGEAEAEEEDLHETHTFVVGGFWVDTAGLLLQDHTRSAPAPLPPVGGRRRASSISAMTPKATAAGSSTNGSGNSYGSLTAGGLLPCHRQLNRRDCPLTPSAGAAAEEEHRMSLLQASLRRCLCDAATAMAELASEEQAAAVRSSSAHRRQSSAADIAASPSSPASGGNLNTNSNTSNGRKEKGGGSGGLTRKDSVRTAAATQGVTRAREAVAAYRRRVMLTGARLLALQGRLAELREAAPLLDVRLTLGRGPPPPLDAEETERQSKERTLGGLKGKKGAKKK